LIEFEKDAPNYLEQRMTPRVWLLIAALMGGLSVTLGAFGAHGLPGFLKAQGVDQAEIIRRLANWETAARYQMYHALALLAVFASAKAAVPLLNAAGWCWLAGMLIFSGCLFALVLTGVKILGAIVPIGGVLLIVGWVLLAVAALRS
jgi:uncharacterized membrane protein YgdD (TMEM256/DUF423 family)